MARAQPSDLVVSPAGQVFRPGENRVGFGVFTVERGQLPDADVALYVARGPDAEALGPFPAQVRTLETEPEFEARTTFEDPDAAKVVYTANVDFPSEGDWWMAALVDYEGELQATRVGTAVVGEYPGVPEVGEKAPVIHTQTVEDVGGDLDQIETRDPADTMHEVDFADVVGKQPVVLVFATPRLCQSRVCGPVVDIAEQVKSETGEGVAFIHQEIFVDNDVSKGLRPQVEAYGLPTEPWVFVIDADGRISTVIEGAFGLTELHEAVAKVAPE